MTENQFRFDRNTVATNLKTPIVYDEERMSIDEVLSKLNELTEEKKEFQFQCNLLREQANEFHRGARENANRVGQLERENKKLKEENENLKQALWEAEKEYLYEVYHDNPIRLQDKIINLKEDWDKEYWND